MTQSSKSLPNPAELAQLEHAFAADPTSDAYRPLAEAYLSMGRFMEAMVVCKKGVKAHPEAANARVLLARVYAEQGKDKKAIEELQGALGVNANDIAALRMLGAILLKSGDQAGNDHLKKAAQLDPADPDTLEVCKKWGIEVAAPKPAPAPAPAPVAAAPVVAPAPVTNGAAHAAPVLQAPAPQAVAAQQPAAAQAQPAAQPTAPAQRPAQARPQQQARPASPARTATNPQRPRAAMPSYEDLASRYGDDEAPKHKSGARGLIATVLIAILGVGGLGGYYTYSKAKAERERKIERLLKQVQEELGHDSYAGYKKACEYGETVLTDLDNSLYSAHAYLAYAYALRWGEHGEGDIVEKSAREHLERALQAKKEHSHLFAAQAYITFFGGQPEQAMAELEKQVAELEKQNRKSPLVYSTLGILAMHAGDLDKAVRYLKEAQKGAPADPRINAQLGNALRRQGNEFSAANAYESALRYEHNHAEAQLGVALMGLDTGKLDVAKRYIDNLTSTTIDPPPSARQLALARMAKAIVLDLEDKKDEADQLERQALETDPRNADLYILKSRRQLKANKADDAVGSIRKAIELEPRRASFYVDLAKALVNKPGGAKEAISSMEQALKSMPGSPKLLVLLGDAYRAAGDLENARVQYEKALAEAKDKLPEARMALADVAGQKKDYAKANELYEKAASEYLTAPERQAYAFTQMGRLADEQGDRPKALDLYKKAATTESTFAPPYYYLGKMFIEDRDKAKREKAVAFFGEYLKLAPKGEFAVEAAKYVPNK